MKLSEAIREGCKYGPQIAGLGVFEGGYCALGSAMKAIGHDPVLWTETEQIWPYASGPAPCPECGIGLTLVEAVIHLNDHHRWSREAIAEWVETVERKLGLWDEPAHDVMAEAQQTVKELTHPVPVQS